MTMDKGQETLRLYLDQEHLLTRTLQIWDGTGWTLFASGSRLSFEDGFAVAALAGQERRVRLSSIINVVAL